MWSNGIVYRGAVLIRSKTTDKYGNVVDCYKTQYTKPYSGKNTASGMATRIAKQYGKSQVLDKWIEEATEWTRL